MKIVAVHSKKGGVGKTSISLLLAKYAVGEGRTACVIDFDFIGSGLANLVSLEKLPDRYLDEFLLSVEPSAFNAEQLLGSYVDKDIEPARLSIVLIREKVLPVRNGEGKAYLRREEDVLDLVSDEPHYKEIVTRALMLLDKLKELHFDLVVLDCHPGLGFASKTIRQSVDLNVYVTTPNRSDCSELLKDINIKRLDGPKSFLIANKAESDLFDFAAFRRLMEKDPIVGTESQTFFPILKFMGQNEAHFALISHSEVLQKMFNIGTSGYLPQPLPAESGKYDFCSKILSLLK